MLQQAQAYFKDDPQLSAAGCVVFEVCPQCPGVCLGAAAFPGHSQLQYPVSSGAQHHTHVPFASLQLHKQPTGPAPSCVCAPTLRACRLPRAASTQSTQALPSTAGPTPRCECGPLHSHTARSSPVNASPSNSGTGLTAGKVVCRLTLNTADIEPAHNTHRRP